MPGDLRKNNNDNKQTNEMTDYINKKIIVLGAGGVGKSALSILFVHGLFVELHDPTVEDFFSKRAIIDDKQYLLHIVDTAGLEEYSMLMRDQYIREGDAFVLVFSLTDVESYEKVREYYNHIARFRNISQVPVLIAANKSDLETERKVAVEDADKLAKEMGVELIVTSAKLSYQVNAIFENVIRKSADHQALLQKPASSLKKLAQSSHDIKKKVSKQPSRSCLLM